MASPQQNRTKSTKKQTNNSTVNVSGTACLSTLNSYNLATDTFCLSSEQTTVSNQRFATENLVPLKAVKYTKPKVYFQARLPRFFKLCFYVNGEDKALDGIVFEWNLQLKITTCS